MPDLVKQTEAAAMTTIKGQGLTLGKRTTKSAPDAVGRVVAQRPAAGAQVEAGAAVDIVIGVAGKATAATGRASGGG
jgi:beta-lactam-binding protein with PASTA domain